MDVFVGFVASNLTVNMTIPTQSDPVPVKSVFGWIIVHQRLGYTFDWTLTWAEYKAGFGSIDADFWLGLERVHLLTSSQPYRLRVEVQSRPRSRKRWYSAEYWSFKIGDELNDKYRLELSGYSGDAGDALQYQGDKRGDRKFGKYYHNGMKFTTIDHDNDNRGVSNPRPNCASVRGGGWWYNNCYAACLTCITSKYSWDTMGYDVVFNSRMMIKLQWHRICKHCIQWFAFVRFSLHTYLQCCRMWLLFITITKCTCMDICSWWISYRCTRKQSNNKKGTAGDLTNCLTCVGLTSKTMERIITSKILNHLYLPNILCQA